MKDSPSFSANTAAALSATIPRRAGDTANRCAAWMPFTSASGRLCAPSSRLDIVPVINKIDLPNADIEDDAYVGVGSVILRKVKTGKRVFGNPAREMDF